MISLFFTDQQTIKSFCQHVQSLNENLHHLSITQKYLKKQFGVKKSHQILGLIKVVNFETSLKSQQQNEKYLNFKQQTKHLTFSTFTNHLKKYSL